MASTISEKLENLPLGLQW